MTVYLPEIMALRRCEDNAGRAAWLLTCEPETLLREELSIRNVLAIAGFREGLAYLDIELGAMRAKRRMDGQAAGLVALEAARRAMMDVACGARCYEGVK